MEENTEGKMDPELGKLESSSAGTGITAPEMQCLSNWEMERINVGGCSLVDGSSNLGETLFPRRTRYRDANRQPRFNISCLIRNR